ncbi:MAG TPA: DNA internalization-related competence protein ComEC/Rec2, partial [Halothiobacillaceae bacterium]|nr:DNA internalization-related competence protein ComEC/Rec2 [Halothiobacillaceae bacterium]
DALLATGTNHLLAISGLHVGLIAGLFGFVMQKVWRHSTLSAVFPAQRAGAMAAVVAAWGYALIAGLSIPTLRAALMLSILLSGLLFKRRWRLFDLWLLAMLAVLLIDPASPLDVGFWLSFAAVLVIIIAVQTRPRGWVLFSLITLQILLFVGLLPLTWGMFDRIPWMSLPANLFAVPLVTIILTPLALMTLFIAAIYPPAAGPLIWVADWLAVALFSVLSWLVEIGPNTLIAAPSLPALVLVTLGCLWLLMPRGWPGKPLALLLFLPAIVNSEPRPAPGELNLVVLDVGQGTAIYIQTHQGDYLYDVGPRWGDFDTGQMVVLPTLRALGVTDLDKIILSHPHFDHVGGLPAVHAQFPDTPIWGEPAPDDAAKIEYQPCEDGYQWQQDGVVFTLKQAPFRDVNEGSCVLLLETANTRILLTGDIEAAGEHWLMRHYSMQADVIYVPHHGSSTSSTEAFVKQTGAQIALNSAGFLNRYGHPHPAVVARWEEQGAAFYNTAEHGALFWENGRVSSCRERRWPFAWRAHGQ